MKRVTRLLVMCGFFITCITLASSNLKPDSEFEMIPIQAVYGQMPGGGGNSNGGVSGPADPSGPSDSAGPPDPSNPDASLGDNSTGTSPDVGNDNNIPGQNDTFGSQNTNNPDAAAQIANPYYNATRSADATPQTNTTAGQAVPEFGPVSILVLAIAVVSIILVAGRTRLRFS